MQSSSLSTFLSGIRGNAETRRHANYSGEVVLEEFGLTHHAQHQLKERKIKLSWLEAALTNPDRVLFEADAAGNTHYLKQIEEFGNRWLRVVVNPIADPQRVITLFFDRRVQ